MAVVVYSDHQEYSDFKSLLRIAIYKHSTYNGEYIKCVVKYAKSISDNQRLDQAIDPDIYRYSVALAKMERVQLHHLHSDEMVKADLIKILEFFESL